MGTLVTDGLTTLLSTCDILVSNTNPSQHAGMWTCISSNKVVGKFVDNVNVTFASGLGGQEVTVKLGMILGISIPLGILLIVLVIVICYCFCCRKNADKTQKKQTSNSSVQTPPKIPQRRQTMFDDIDEETTNVIGRPIIIYPPAESGRKVSTTASIHSHRIPPIKKSSIVWWS